MLGDRFLLRAFEKCPRCTTVSVNMALRMFICYFRCNFNTAVQVCPDLVFPRLPETRLHCVTIQLKSLNKHVLLHTLRFPGRDALHFKQDWDFVSVA